MGLITKGTIMQSVINIFIDDDFFEVKFKKFSDMTIQCDIPNLNHEGKNLLIEAKIVDSDGIIALLQVKDIIDHYLKDLSFQALKLSYLPYARYDRRMIDNDAFSLKVFANLINGMQFDYVYADDVHNPIAAAALIKNLVILNDQTSLIALLKIDMGVYDYIVSPDNGATKKAALVGDFFKIPVIEAVKARDPETGHTSFKSINVDPKLLDGKRVLIVDDICDGGATFKNLGHVLKSLGAKTDLFISHAILKNGLSLENIDNIFFYNDIGKQLGYKR